MTFRRQKISICLCLRILSPPRVQFVFDGVPFDQAQVVQSVQRVVGPGTVLEPLVVAPAISVSIMPQAGIVPLDTKSFEVTVNLHSNVKGPANGTVKLDLPEGWKAPQEEFSTSKDGDDLSLNFQVTPIGLKGKVLRHNGRRHLRWPRLQRGLSHHRLFRIAPLQSLSRCHLSHYRN